MAISKIYFEKKLWNQHNFRQFLVDLFDFVIKDKNIEKTMAKLRLSNFNQAWHYTQKEEKRGCFIAAFTLSNTKRYKKTFLFHFSGASGQVWGWKGLPETSAMHWYVGLAADDSSHSLSYHLYGWELWPMRRWTGTLRLLRHLDPFPCNKLSITERLLGSFPTA